MKIMTLFIAILISSLGHARTFNQDSVLPKELRDLIIEEIVKQVPCVEKYSLKERSTQVREDRIDQGVVDYYYKTVLTGSYLYDSYHPARMIIEIDTVEYMISNPSVQKFFVLNSNLDEFTCDTLF